MFNFIYIRVVIVYEHIGVTINSWTIKIERWTHIQFQVSAGIWLFFAQKFNFLRAPEFFFSWTLFNSMNISLPYDNCRIQALQCSHSMEPSNTARAVWKTQVDVTLAVGRLVSKPQGTRTELESRDSKLYEKNMISLNSSIWRLLGGINA